MDNTTLIILLAGGAYLLTREPAKTPSNKSLNLVDGGAKAPTISTISAKPLGAKVVGGGGVFTTVPFTAGSSSAQIIASQQATNAVQQKKPGVLTLTNWAGVEAWAQVLAANTIVLAGGKPPTNPEYDVTQSVFLLPTSIADMQFQKIASNLVTIGNIKTSGPSGFAGIGHLPPYWIPVNPGIYREGDNEFTVPFVPYDRIVQKFKDLSPLTVGPDGKQYRNITNVIRELSTLYGISWQFKYVLDKDPSLIKKALDTAIKIGAAALAGASAGWVGALAGAVSALVSQIVADLEAATKKDGIEADIVAKYNRAIVNNWGDFTSPLKELGYEFTSKVHASRVHQFPANLWFQSAPHNVAGIVIEQGVYPGCGLYAYMGNDSTRYYASVDGADLVSGASWYDAIQAKNPGGGQKPREEYFA